MERGPAHKVVPRKIGETLNELIAKEQGQCPDAFRAETLVPRLLMGVLMLKNMSIPDKHVDEVRQWLEMTANGPLPEIGQKIIRHMLLPASIFARPARTEKRGPAHVVIPHLMKDAIVSVAGRTNLGPIRIEPFVGRLTIGIDILKEMIVPEKHIQEVAKALYRIMAICPPSVIAQTFAGLSVIPDIIPAPSETAEPSHRPDEIPAVATADQLTP